MSAGSPRRRCHEFHRYCRRTQLESKTGQAQATGGRAREEAASAGGAMCPLCLQSSHTLTTDCEFPTDFVRLGWGGGDDVG